jgi:hypothetical protein
MISGPLERSTTNCCGCSRKTRDLNGSGIWPEDPAAVGVDTARLRRYRDLMEQLGVKSLERYFGTVLFITSSGGLVPSGYMKGYVYADKAPSPLVSDSAKPLEEGEFYRHIDGNWYLIYGSY